MGAVVDGGTAYVVRNEDLIRLCGVAEHDFEVVRDRELAEIERRRQRYLADRARAEVEGRTVIVIDDGIATGATARAALEATRLRKPKRLVLAVPVAPPQQLGELRNIADDVVCLEQPEFFIAIGIHYAHFSSFMRWKRPSLLRLQPRNDLRPYLRKGLSADQNAKVLQTHPDLAGVFNDPLVRA